METGSDFNDKVSITVVSTYTNASDGLQALADAAWRSLDPRTKYVNILNTATGAYTSLKASIVRGSLVVTDITVSGYKLAIKSACDAAALATYVAAHSAEAAGSYLAGIDIDLINAYAGYIFPSGLTSPYTPVAGGVCYVPDGNSISPNNIPYIAPEGDAVRWTDVASYLGGGVVDSTLSPLNPDFEPKSVGGVKYVITDVMVTLGTYWVQQFGEHLSGASTTGRYRADGGDMTPVGKGEIVGMRVPLSSLTRFGGIVMYSEIDAMTWGTFGGETGLFFIDQRWSSLESVNSAILGTSNIFPGCVGGAPVITSYRKYDGVEEVTTQGTMIRIELFGRGLSDAEIVSSGGGIVGTGILPLLGGLGLLGMSKRFGGSITLSLPSLAAIKKHWRY